VNQRVALRQLQKLGYSAEAVANGMEAVEALERIPYDIVLMDCQMPEMDGYAATAAIRRREGESKHTTVIAMTANALQGDREKCLAAGMDDYVSKPIKTDELETVLMRWEPEPPEAATATPGTHEAAAAAAPGLEDETPVIDIEGNGITSDARRRAGNGNGQIGPAELLDHKTLAALRELAADFDPGFLDDLIDTFVESAERYLDELRAAVEDEDPPEVERAAHTLKGSSGNLGAKTMVELCVEIEARAHHGSLVGIGAQIKQLEATFKRVAVALQAERSGGA
jgi:CheY-like chemotaxis protein